MDDPTANWNGLTPKEAIQLQKDAAHQVITEDNLPSVTTVAGVDVGFEDNQTARAAIVVLNLSDLTPVDFAIARRTVPMPYIPGLLSFRECPAILDALAKLSIKPDLLLCDGQGIAHPRRLGVASHTGLLTGIPAIGVGKSRLTGTHLPVPDEKGAWVPLQDRSEEIGAVLRTRVGVKPLFISPGHLVSLPTALHYVMACVTRYRLPETTRWADGIASQRGYKWLEKLEAIISAGGVR